MKLTEPDLKIKVRVSNLSSFCYYLSEILKHYEKYVNNELFSNSINGIIKHSLQTLLEKSGKLALRHLSLRDVKCTLSINYAERLALYELTARYPLPLEINFIEYEIKNGLLK